VVSGVGLGMGVLDFGGDRRRGTGSLGVNLQCPIVTNGDFVALLCGIAYIELSCIHVLDGSPRDSRGRGCFWHGLWHFSKFRFYSFEWRNGVLIMVLINDR